jgi:diguanylate cyclase (GGDEF)-like protein
METANNNLATTELLVSATVEEREREIEALRSQLASLTEQLKARLIQEQQLAQVNHSLRMEIIDRQQTEATLRLLLERLASEKSDLEIILDTTTDHSDTIEAMLYDRALSLTREATIDGLTQIANRRAFDQRLEKEWQRLARENLPMSLLLCDVDFFKRYNDRYGHPAGDDCLRAVAKAIESCIRRPADLAARYGGEEFAVILPNTEQNGAIFVANKISEAVAALDILHDASYVKDRVSLSIGISTAQPKHKTEPRKLIESTDKALYLAKSEGRDRVVFAQVEI